MLIKHRQLTRTGFIVFTILAMILGGVVGHYLSRPSDDPWPEALKSSGLDANTIANLLELPGEPILTTDSLGFQQATGAIFYKVVDDDGQPLLAVYYTANRVVLNNLPQNVTDSTKGELSTESVENP